MRIRISPDEGVPVYQQIVNQIKYLVASKVLRPGDELPPIRALAEQLLINPNTVARAYRELEIAGLVVKRGTVGTFVSSSPSPFARRERLRIVRQKVDTLLAEASALGVDVEELKAVIDQRASAMHAGLKSKRGGHES
ncbi:MAG TPA: GntR family transcriptional regulator [Gammaproteobacteria bacterium]